MSPLSHVAIIPCRHYPMSPLSHVAIIPCAALFSYHDAVFTTPSDL
jgi:hypothetical protein